MWPDNDNNKLAAIITVFCFSAMAVVAICDALVKVFAK